MDALSSSFTPSLLWVLASGVLALAAAGVFRYLIGKESDGNDLMRKIAGKSMYRSSKHTVSAPAMIEFRVKLLHHSPSAKKSMLYQSGSMRTTITILFGHGLSLC